MDNNSSNSSDWLLQLKESAILFCQDFNEVEHDFDSIGNLHVAATFVKQETGNYPNFQILISKAEYLSLIHFEAACLVKPLLVKTTSEFQDIVYIKYLGLLADSWYESLEYHFGKELFEKLYLLPNEFAILLRRELKLAYGEREHFRVIFKKIRNSVIAHRCSKIGDILTNDDSAFGEDYLKCIIDFLIRILSLKALLMKTCCDCYDQRSL
jgi:hypothetical protein